MALKNCIDRFENTRKECTEWRDDGYETCEEWGKDCVSWAEECVVSWIPLIGPAICKVFEWVCKAFEAVCIVAVWVSQWVCHAWNVITTTVCLVFETVGVLLSFVGVFIKAILSIPIIGAIIREILNFVTGVVLGLVGFVIEGVVCGLLGSCFSKRMKVCVIITHNGRGPVATQAELQSVVMRMVQIYNVEAGVKIEVSYGDGARVPNVEPGCGLEAWTDDLWLTGTQYENAASLHCSEYNLASVIGLGSPLYAFCVQDVEGKNGCSLGLLSNYVTFERPADAQCSGDTHLAHEVGHAMGLLHPVFDTDTSNLMHDACVDPGRDQLSPFQKAIVRGSKYCTYF